MKRKICIITTFMFILDQLVKCIIISSFPYQKITFLIPNFFYFTYVKNTGGAWSIFNNNIWILLIVGIICMIGLGYYIFKKQEFRLLEVIYLGLMSGGILGNFVDRVFRDGVIDYIGIIFGSYYFPVFNIADICIVCGVFLFMIDSFRRD